MYRRPRQKRKWWTKDRVLWMSHERSFYWTHHFYEHGWELERERNSMLWFQSIEVFFIQRFEERVNGGIRDLQRAPRKKKEEKSEQEGSKIDTNPLLTLMFEAILVFSQDSLVRLMRSPLKREDWDADILGWLRLETKNNSLRFSSFDGAQSLSLASTISQYYKYDGNESHHELRSHFSFEQRPRIAWAFSETISQQTDHAWNQIRKQDKWYQKKMYRNEWKIRQTR